jgi:hypothetical protein
MIINIIITKNKKKIKNLIINIKSLQICINLNPFLLNKKDSEIQKYKRLIGFMLSILITI